jgi:hypothetical protein
MSLRILAILAFGWMLFIGAEAVLAQGGGRQPSRQPKPPTSRKVVRSNSAPSKPPANTHAQAPSPPKGFFGKLKSLFTRNRSAPRPSDPPNIAPFNPLSDASRPRYDFSPGQNVVQSSLQPRMNDVSLYSPVRSAGNQNANFRAPQPYGVGNQPGQQPRPNQPIGPANPAGVANAYPRLAAQMQRPAPQQVSRNAGIAPPKPQVGPIAPHSAVNQGNRPAAQRPLPQGLSDRDPVLSSVEPKANPRLDPEARLKAMVGGRELAALVGNRIADPREASPGAQAKLALQRWETDVRKDLASETAHKGPNGQLQARAVPQRSNNAPAIGPIRKAPRPLLQTRVRRSNSPNSKRLAYRPGMKASELGSQLEQAGYRQYRGFYSSRNPDGETPDAGWKIHVSADPDDPARNIVETFNVLESLRLGEGEGKRVQFKVWDPDKLQAAAQSAPHQIGKYITIYPRNADEAVTISKVLGRALPDSPNHMPVVGDKQAYAGKPVYLRYGAINDDGDNHPIPANLVDKPPYAIGQRFVRDDDLRQQGIAFPAWKQGEWTQIRQLLNEGIVNDQ